MTKIMLVEDDNNLREIYGARLQAEGYEIVSAKDGEEALALAVREKPDLIISDVMMPKISGFDMLDILRSTPETKYTKVIMMTALSQKEDEERGHKLGADRYLVKSQVTLEDVVRVVSEVLAGEPTTTLEEFEAPQQVVTPTPAPEPVAAPAPAAQPAVVPEPAQPATPAPEQVVAAPEPVAPAASPVPTPVQVTQPTPDPTPAPEPVAEATTQDVTPTPTPISISGESSHKEKVISPINDINSKPDVIALMEKEMLNEAAADLSGAISPNIPVDTLAHEQEIVNEQISDFVNNDVQQVESAPETVAQAPDVSAAPSSSSQAEAPQQVVEQAPITELVTTPAPEPMEVEPAPSTAENTPVNNEPAAATPEETPVPPEQKENLTDLAL
jgi:CheY-like chemotaxis protein